MEARYLRVKNHADHQHYDPLLRRPPWIKLYNTLLGGEADGFALLSEQEQWQLVRIWLVASKSSTLTHDENGKVVPVVADDEKSLRRSTMSLKRIPLAKFIRDGWLIPVAESELLAASTPIAQLASADASALLDTEEQRVRDSERPKGFSPGDQEKPSDFTIRTLKGVA